VIRDAQGKKRRLDYELIQNLVPPNSRVLDLGCGDGQLLDALMRHKGCQGRGIEIDERAVGEAIRRGVPVYHGDMLEGMTHFRDGSFDVVILSQTLQQTSDPIAVIHEMLRVGQTAIISFPNFGHWRVRLSLLLRGRMPMTGQLPYPWYSTPNVHLCTITDFRALCAEQRLNIMNEISMAAPDKRIGPTLANCRGELAIFQLRSM
jgi:methionine biosynthesis protein MetW